MKKSNQWFLVAALSAILFAGCEKTEQKPIQILDHTRSELTVRLQENSELVHRVYRDTTIELSTGVSETHVHLMDVNGHSLRIFILEADLNQPAVKLHPLTPFGEDAYARQTVPEMVSYAESEGRVLFASNADFFAGSTGEPRSIVYKSGAPIRTIIPAGWTFFGVSKSGELMIGNDADYEREKANIYHALGGNQTLVKNGEPVIHTDNTIEPRTAVGYTADNHVYFMVVDGRKYDYSYGVSFTDLGQLMHALGVTESINLDGGGSSTFLVNDPAESTYKVRNRTSDGAPRAVANGWAIIAE